MPYSDEAYRLPPAVLEDLKDILGENASPALLTDLASAVDFSRDHLSAQHPTPGEVRYKWNRARLGLEATLDALNDLGPDATGLLDWELCPHDDAPSRVQRVIAPVKALHDEMLPLLSEPLREGRPREEGRNLFAFLVAMSLRENGIEPKISRKGTFAKVLQALLLEAGFAHVTSLQPVLRFAVRAIPAGNYTAASRTLTAATKEQ